MNLEEANLEEGTMHMMAAVRLRSIQREPLGVRIIGGGFTRHGLDGDPLSPTIRFYATSLAENNVENKRVAETRMAAKASIH